MPTKKIWIASYNHGLMPETKIMAYDEEDARKEAYAVYRFHSYQSYDAERWEGQVVRSVRLAENQDVFDGTMVMPVSIYPPEKAVVNIHVKEDDKR